MNPRDAERLGITDGDSVSLNNELGSIRVEVEVTHRVLQRVLWSPRLLKGLNGEPQNLLMNGEAQKIGGGPVFNSTIVNVYS
jgi:anaerobic selenocysteine-containing dehydrogenase